MSMIVVPVMATRVTCSIPRYSTDTEVKKYTCYWLLHQWSTYEWLSWTRAWNKCINYNVENFSWIQCDKTILKSIIDTETGFGEYQPSPTLVKAIHSPGGGAVSVTWQANEMKWWVFSVFLWHMVNSLRQPWQQGSWGQHGAHLWPTGPRWAPCSVYDLASRPLAQFDLISSWTTWKCLWAT